VHYCLNREELKQLLDFKTDSVVLESGLLSNRIANAENWQDELCGITYLFSKILEKRLKDGSDCNYLIDVLYSLEEEMWFHVQECDTNFIEYMLRNIRTIGLSLDEELIELQSKIGNHMYERALRY
jgi:hypothetical protein